MTSSKKFNPFKDLQSDQIQKSSFKIFTAHYACRNADLNLTVVRVMTNGFIFQLINSLIECWAVRLTCLDCKALDFDWFSPQPYSHQKTTKHIPYSFYNHRSTEWLLHEIYVSDKSKRGSTFPCVYTDIRHFRLPREGREEGMIW